MKITSADQKVDWSQEIQGDVEFAPNFGIVQVPLIWCTGSITAGMGTHIKAGTSIDAGTYINAGGYIKAGTYINAGGYINAGTSIDADGYINAGTSIDADGYITAGNYGITAGFYITCKETLSAKMRIIAGVFPTLDGTDPSCSHITCGKLLSGTVVGELVETGLPDAKPCTPETIVVDGVTYRREDSR